MANKAAIKPRAVATRSIKIAEDAYGLALMAARDTDRTLASVVRMAIREYTARLYEGDSNGGR